MVIVEGPDSAGKTTLIQHLVEHFDGQLIVRDDKQDRNSPSFRDPENVRKRVYKAICDEVIGDNRAQVHDRLFFSELAYGSVLRGEVCFPWKEQQHILRLLTAISPPIVFCLPPLEAIHAKILGAHQMEGATANIDAIYAKYEAMRALQHPKVTLYDYTRGPAAKERICRLTAAYLERRNRRTAWSRFSSTTTKSSH